MNEGRMMDKAALMNTIATKVHYDDSDPRGSYAALLAVINNFPTEGEEPAAEKVAIRAGDVTPNLRRTIAIDFDGCLCSENWPGIGVPNWDIISEAKREQKDGAALILWTCREGKLLAEAVEACRNWGLVFDAVNESTPEWIAAWGGDTRKVGATEYWDDRAANIDDICEGRPQPAAMWEWVKGVRLVNSNQVVVEKESPERASETEELIARLQYAADQMQLNVHSPGHIAAIIDAIKALKEGA